MLTPESIAALRFRLASPDEIRSWSSGEVTKPHTINYRNGQPDPHGLLSERIFGPMQDWTCSCGRHRRQYAPTPGFVCARCGVELAPRRVRRERMGHIELAVPVAHPWFARGTPCVMAELLGLSRRQLLAVLSYSGRLVLALDERERCRCLDGSQAQTPDKQHLLTSLGVGRFLTSEQARWLAETHPLLARTGAGAQAVRERLTALDLARLAHQLRTAIEQGEPSTRHLVKRLRIVEALRESGINPAWMILTVLPVLPPELRPLVPLEGGKMAASDVNRLYELVLYRNERVRHFARLDAPEVMRLHEQRLLQEAVDALFDNGHCRRKLTGSHGQPLKSLTDALGGKMGRLRRNLLGKRVDYSGRSVIVGDPQLLLHQCGLPTRMALELFQPFLVRKLLERNLAATPRAAKRRIERARETDLLLWKLLDEVMYGRVVLLNRAPTLHRLSIQAFEPVRVSGSALRLHPMVCSAFNADFDGDQMAVHLPLSETAQTEARRLLLSTRNLRSPASGEPSISPSQDIVLGLFYLTQERPSPKHKAGRIFSDSTEALLAYEHGVIDLHTPIEVRLEQGIPCCWTAPGQPSELPPHRRMQTTAGRLLFNAALPEALRFHNYEMTKERLKRLFAQCLNQLGEEALVGMADRLKTLGFHHATQSGVSFALSDIVVPPEKQMLIEQAERAVHAIDEQYMCGTITLSERDQQHIAIWTSTTEQVGAVLERALPPFGALATIINSGATKAKLQQIRQLSGMRGLLARPGGEIIPIPVRGNYLSGLTSWEVYIAASAARKGFMDRSLNTAPSGYLTRRLVEAGMDTWITERDCGTTEGLVVSIAQRTEAPSRVIGRLLAEAIPEAHLPAGTLLNEVVVERLLHLGVARLLVRSPLMCRAQRGICAHCYGLDLSTGKLVEVGVAVGIIAAQSIGEPGTQLTMRTFHSGGIAGAQGDITQGLPRIEELFEARHPRKAAVLAEIEGIVASIEGERTAGTLQLTVQGEQESRAYPLSADSALLVEPGAQVHPGTALTAGPLDLQRLLALAGPQAVACYLVQEVQRVYRTAGVYLHDKHVECIVRRLLRFVEVQQPGDTSLFPGDLIERSRFIHISASVLAQGGSPPRGRVVLCGLTRAILQMPSPLAAAAFQETRRVLTWAALSGTREPLSGWKERLVVGKRLPTSGSPLHQETTLQQGCQETCSKGGD